MKNSDKKKQFSASKLKSSEQWHLYLVYSDPEFVATVENLAEPPDSPFAEGDWRLPYKDLSREYKVSYLSVYLFKMHRLEALVLGAKLLPAGLVRYNEREGVIEIKARKDIVQQEFYELWKQVDSIKQNELGLKPTKRKPPENPQLIYAIFKAKKSGLTRKQIFNKYKSGELDYYRHKPSIQFDNEYSLDDYYLNYQPTI